MVYSDQYKFIFLAVPKTGSRTIQDYLQNYGIRSKKGWNPNHDGYEDAIKNVERDPSEYFKFAFFRNPWSLLISIFYYNRHTHSFPPTRKGVMEWLYYYRGGDSYVPYLYDKNGNMVLDFIGKLEHIDEDFKIVCEKLKLPVPIEIPHVGKQAVKGRLHYTEYYEPQMRDKIAGMFSKSNAILNYKFEDADR